jgi:hypothetical protein
MPKKFGGIGILNLKKFALSLRMRWLWSEWSEDLKSWVGHGTPCNAHDKELFGKATIVTIGNRENASF